MIHRLDDQFACLVVEKLLMERTKEQDVTPPRMSHVCVDVNMDRMQNGHHKSSDNSGNSSIYFFNIMYCCSLYRSNEARLR